MFKSKESARLALQTAIHRTSSNYRNEEGRGATALARRFGFNEGSFSNKCLANAGDHHLSLMEAMLLMRESNNIEVLRVMASLLDCVVHTVPDYERVSDAALLELWCDSIEKAGGFAAKVRMSLEDGIVTGNEFRNVVSALHIMMSSNLTFVARLEGMVKT